MGFIVQRISFLICLFASATAFSERYQSPEYIRYVDEITKQFKKEIKKEFGLICTCTGGQMPYDVEIISVSFSANRRSSIEKARELEVLCTERLVSIMNSHSKIRPFLRKYPVDSSMAQVDIAFHKGDGTRYTDGSVAFVVLSRGKIHYCQKNPATKRLEDLIEEPYEEARKIVLGAE